MRYSKMLEETTFRGRRADFIWFLIVSCGLLLILSPLSPTPFLSSSLSFTVGPSPSTSSIPLTLCMTAGLSLVSIEPPRPPIAIRRNYHHCAVPPLCPLSLLLGSSVGEWIGERLGTRRVDGRCVGTLCRSLLVFLYRNLEAGER